MSVAHEIRKLFLSNNVVNLHAKLEGQRCEGRRYFVGAKTGPSYSLAYLLHEICHFAELDIVRLSKFPAKSWGLYHGKFWQIGSAWGYEPSTDQQVKRESRVWAFQLSAQRHFGLNDSAAELVSSAVYLPAFCYYKSCHKRRVGWPSDERALYYLAKHVERQSKHYSFQRLLDDFNFRVNTLSCM